ncbi:GTP cyclohydrolase FolE2 [Marinobacterium zhoushanense]|uniref:GTP cyclohydrolase FolE2 n=1 Tax=Marinobacterium zhoushanense TaxID=1679163 RepID=A0ABQ1JV97_9GAMM|nr:GTP cyclohydrolase FolE2 [Marinobacterium zhoushanense]GGB79165.1 GTP cyclohydrolase FolE2 [Marinobacterium zhoushanense]
MNTLCTNHFPIPDIATTDRAAIKTTLDWVGMSGLALPFQLLESRRGPLACQGSADIHVDIVRPEVKGIHMSRLYLLLEDLAEETPLSPETLSGFLHRQLASHHEISRSAGLSIRFQYLSRRAALKSEHRGWKRYPSAIHAELRDGRPRVELELAIPYSSTCPCSASLSRQLLAEALDDDFAGRTRLTMEEVQQWLLRQGSLATPHSQRSWAQMRLQLAADAPAFAIEEIIEVIENALGTPVQTAVKREDEQAFARLNGSNLMFCEDAARRIKQILANREGMLDFWVRVEHQESLHAHDAVAVATAGVAGGYRPDLGSRSIHFG